MAKPGMSFHENVNNLGDGEITSQERKDNLNEEEAQDVLIEFADSLDRGYKRQLKTEPARLLRTPVSWLSDLYHFHFNIREIWN